MSIECSNVVWNRNFKGSSRKMIAVKLADHADDEGRGVWPSVEKIAAKCDLSCRTVQRVLADFVTEGILKVVSEGGRGPGSTTRYDFDMAVVRSLPLAVAPPDSGVVKPENKGDTMSPLANSKGDIDDAKGDIDDNKGDTVSPKPSITIIEPSNGRVRERESEKGEDGYAAMRRGLKKWPTGFDDSEREARKAWERLTTEERLQALDRQADYVASVKASGRTKFCAYSVYLSEKRWERLPERSAQQARAVEPAYGPAWGAVCIETLLAGAVSLGPPDVTREMKQTAYEGMVRLRGVEKAREFYQRQGFEFDADGTMIFPDDFEDRLWREHLLKNGYPVVNALYAQAEAGQGLAGSDAERGRSLAPLMEFVVADSALFQAWEAEFEARLWPFPKLGRMRGLYFPAGGPEQLHDFSRAIG